MTLGSGLLPPGHSDSAAHADEHLRMNVIPMERKNIPTTTLDIFCCADRIELTRSRQDRCRRPRGISPRRRLVEHPATTPLLLELDTTRSTHSAFRSFFAFPIIISSTRAAAFRRSVGACDRRGAS